MDRSKILVTGATGKTGRRLVALLRRADIDYVAASRRPDDPKSLPFDWMDPDGHGRALEGVTGVYVIFPSDGRDPAPLVIAIRSSRAIKANSIEMLQDTREAALLNSWNRATSDSSTGAFGRCGGPPLRTGLRM